MQVVNRNRLLWTFTCLIRVHILCLLIPCKQILLIVTSWYELRYTTAGYCLDFLTTEDELRQSLEMQMKISIFVGRLRNICHSWSTLWTQSVDNPRTTPMDPALIFEDDVFRSLTEIYSEDS